MVLGDGRQYLCYRLLEPHVEHLVGLVEHYVVHVLGLHLSAVHEVYEPSRRCHDDLCAVAEVAYLLFYACAAIDGDDMHVGDVLRKGVDVVANLQAELTGGAQHYRLEVLLLVVHTLEERYAEGGGLAGSCLR